MKKRLPQKREKEAKPKAAKEGTKKLSFNEKRELEQLEQDITSLEREKLTIEQLMNSGDCPAEELVIKSQRHGEIRELLNDKELRWLELSDMGSWKHTAVPVNSSQIGDHRLDSMFRNFRVPW